MKNSARETAFKVLLKIEKDKAYSNLTLDAALKESRLSSRDKAFASALVYGVLERQITIDYELSLHLKQPLKKLKKQVLVALRLGAFQLLFLNSVPTSAAVNESVVISKENGFSFASGLINAVLRAVSKSGLLLPEKNDFQKYISIKYSCPEWLVSKWSREYGEKMTEEILKHSIGTPKITVRVNTLKTTSDELLELLTNSAVVCETGVLSNSIVINSLPCAVEELDEFKNGLFHVQGIPSQLCSLTVGAKENDVVFDLCSAPGGKAFTVAEEMKNKGVLKAFDVYEKRVGLIKSGAKRLGLDCIDAAMSNAEAFDPTLGFADCVLCDVPCSGLGIISKKPEIKFKSEEDFAALPEIQFKILENGSKYVKDGGRLVYSTCTLSKAENEEVCNRFLKEHPEFISQKPFFKKDDGSFATVFPSENNSDGFFVALFVRKEKL